MDSGGAKITLDQESFRALASDVRVEILKRLDVRRETVTDLSNLLSLSKPTLLEHLEKLQSASLVKRVDEGRKWIYYELSEKGRKILHPERVAITVALAAAVLLAAVGIFYLLAAGIAASPVAPAPELSQHDRALPAAQQYLAAPGLAPGVLLIFLSIVALSLALVLRRVGLRQRARFFEQLSTT
jgi:DNA-binding transcriptional ArsR family regulator